MADEKKPVSPFLLLTDKLPPRVGPTMSSILARLDELKDLYVKSTETCGQVLKRQQQLALMVDGSIATINRRFDVLHEEQALMRVTLARPSNDNEIPVVVEPQPATGRERARALVLGTFKGTSYLTSIAVLLRLVQKAFPEYGAAIDGLLGLFQL
jgi:hypothetical protein